MGTDVHLLLAATETAQQLKRSAGVPFHAKGRGLLRKMDTTSKAAPLARVAPLPSVQAGDPMHRATGSSAQRCLSLIRQEGLT